MFSNRHIKEELLKLRDSQFLRSLLFINCGGYLDMTDQWFKNAPKVKCYLIDSHRPYNHNNVNDESNKVFVIHDGCRSFDECPTKEDDRMYEELH